MVRKRTDTKADVKRLRTALLNVEDEVCRLIHICHLGGLAADGMHGLARSNPDATALAFYFIALRADLEKLKGMCRKGR